jgi:iron(III) transport system ATP-binding protein
VSMLEIRDLVKNFPDKREGVVRAIDSVSFDVEEGKMFTLLGPSGCGKTTTLRCIAGLETPDSGEIALKDRVLFSSTRRIKLRANERGLGMVFQSYAIWPHMNVFNNVAFPLTVIPRGKRPNRRTIAERVQRVLSVVHLDQLADRQATDLSGGQQQRLALARALVMEPPLLLLDEPLSNLDAKLREEMRFELKRLQRELGITAIYVTHDQTEALAMSNIVAVMRDGRMEQVGKPREIYERPMSRFVADFIGISNFIPGTVESSSKATCRIATGEGPLTAGAVQEWPAGQKVVVSVRPEHVRIQPLAEGEFEGANVWKGVVHQRAFLGECVDHVVTVGGIELRARTNPSISLRPGTDVSVALIPERCSLIAAGD